MHELGERTITGSIGHQSVDLPFKPDNPFAYVVGKIRPTRIVCSAGAQSAVTTAEAAYGATRHAAQSPRSQSSRTTRACGVSAQRGQIFRMPNGLWAIRWRESVGRRPQKTGYRTKGEAREALEEDLRRVRLGPLHRPNITLREMVDAYVDQYDAALSTIAWLRDNMRPALEAWGDRKIGSLTVPEIGTWRQAIPEGKRYRSHRALRQVLQAAVRWRWIEDNGRCT
jgi:hypothetical protein